MVTVSLRKSANADEVYEAVVKKINMSKKVSKYFYLFEIVEYNFGEYLWILWHFLVDCWSHMNLEDHEVHIVYIYGYWKSDSTG